ncbi:MAG: hypothetical protein ACK55S_03525 [Planctomycetota bacterium]
MSIEVHDVGDKTCQTGSQVTAITGRRFDGTQKRKSPWMNKL